MALPTTLPATPKDALPRAAPAAICIGAVLVTLLLLSVQARMQMGSVPPAKSVPALHLGAGMEDFCSVFGLHPLKCVEQTCCPARIR